MPTSAQPKSGSHKRIGVLATARIDSAGRTTIVLDDVTAENLNDKPVRWTEFSLYTEIDLGDFDLGGFAMSDELLARIGYAILIRLAAIAADPPDSDG